MQTMTKLYQGTQRQQVCGLCRDKNPATIILMLEQELVLPSDEVQNPKKPTLLQQITIRKFTSDYDAQHYYVVHYAQQGGA
jgi:hypothetical protein